ncbi:hypothetical protein SRB5_69520 [Streptomyces sp. RB5]|uniref:Uncharacterized protein n=1 Tax=Streptomyces smaragdinus TaxID=2585196 RepID=A0A7K0CTF7_9ACTN|nr:hypothetical protein [Streptomyces smaragdinus]MQY16749.1 hypothetical protein [Streptomyces smaragdinus]
MGDETGHVRKTELSGITGESQQNGQDVECTDLKGRDNPTTPNGTPRAHPRTPKIVAISLAGILTGATLTAGAAATLWPTPDHTPRITTLREDEHPLDGKEHRSGLILFRPLGIRCHIEVITGTHLDYYPKGQLCRIRVAATMTGSTFATIDNRLHRLVLDNGTKTEIDWQVTQIKRQPAETEVAALGTTVYDLWFDIPRNAQPVRLELKAEPIQPEAAIPLPHGE